MSRQFFESMSKDPLIDHDDNCGQCEHMKIMAQVAREMLEEENFDLKAWDLEVRDRWEKSKYFKLWQEETKAGRNPNDVQRGWEP